MASICDRCGCNAWPYGTRSINRDGRVIELCGTHTREHRDALVKQGWTTVDLANIETEPSKSGEPDALHAPE